MKTTHHRSLKAQLAYWLPTALVVLCMTFGGIADALCTPQAHEVMQRLGYPDYFTILLGVAKLLGVLALLLPVPRVLREWAYAGFSFDTMGAAISILATGGAPAGPLAPLFALVCILLSRRAWLQRSVATAQGASVTQHAALA